MAARKKSKRSKKGKKAKKRKPLARKKRKVAKKSKVTKKARKKAKAKKKVARKSRKKAVKKRAKKKVAKKTKKKTKAEKKVAKKAMKKAKARKKVAKRKATPRSKAPAKKTVVAATPAAAPVADEERIGVVTHYYTHLSVAVVHLDAGALRVGDKIHIKGYTSDFTQTVASMEIDHVHVNEARAGQSFGLKDVEHAREHDEVFRVRTS